MSSLSGIELFARETPEPLQKLIESGEAYVGKAIDGGYRSAVHCLDGGEIIGHVEYKTVDGAVSNLNPALTLLLKAGGSLLVGVGVPWLRHQLTASKQMPRSEHERLMEVQAARVRELERRLEIEANRASAKAIESELSRARVQLAILSQRDANDKP